LAARERSAADPTAGFAPNSLASSSTMRFRMAAESLADTPTVAKLQVSCANPKTANRVTRNGPRADYPNDTQHFVPKTRAVAHVSRDAGGLARHRHLRCN
jgi:hypothetical protein